MFHLYPTPLRGVGGGIERAERATALPTRGRGGQAAGVRALREIGLRGGQAGRKSDEGGCRLWWGPLGGAKAGCLPQEPALLGLPLAPRRWARAPMAGRGTVGG